MRKFYLKGSCLSINDLFLKLLCMLALDISFLPDDIYYYTMTE